MIYAYGYRLLYEKKQRTSKFNRHSTMGGGGRGKGGCNPKTEKKKIKDDKNSAKIEICCSLRIFRFFSVFLGFCGTFSVYFGLNLYKKFEPFYNHVTSEV